MARDCKQQARAIFLFCINGTRRIYARNGHCIGHTNVTSPRYRYYKETIRILTLERQVIYCYQYRAR
jgi:hypothetical protein